MKTASTAYGAIAESNSARYYAKYIVDGKERKDELNDFKLKARINPENNIGIGNTCSNSVSFSIYKPAVSLENKEITLFQGVRVNNTIEHVKLGIFKITKQESDGEYTKYEGYDRMYSLMEIGYFSDIAFPSTDEAILKEICSQTGIAFASSITSHMIEEKPEGYTRREMIGYMAALQGKNALINADGNLELRWYSDTGYELDNNRYYQGGITFTTSKDFTLQLLTCNNGSKGEKSTISSGAGAAGITFTNPFMTQDILDDVYKKIGGFTYRPITVKFIGDFRIEPGDIVTVQKDGANYKVPVMQITHECDGGLISTIKSIGQSDTLTSNVSSGPVAKAMERYYGELVLVNNALINKLDAETANITYASIRQLSAVNATIDDLKANTLTAQTADLKYATINSLDSAAARITVLEAGSADIGNLRSQVADINTLMFGTASGGSLTTEFSNSVVSLIGDAQIKSAMIKDVAADKITAGKIYTNLVEVCSQSGNLGISDNTILIRDDAAAARVQIGKDASGDYNLYLWDAAGRLMFDAQGITADGIQRPIIRDDMVSDYANISAKKLDITSLFTEINGSTETIKSSKIFLDADGQTLDVAFKTVRTETAEASTSAAQALTAVNSVTETVTSQGTQLTAVQGQIASKVWQQDITTAVNNIAVGGRNYALDTGNSKSFTFSNYSDGANMTFLSYRINISPRWKAGDKITVHFDFDAENVVIGENGSIQIQGTGNVTQWNPGYFGPVMFVKGPQEKLTKTIHVSLQKTISAEILKNSYWNVHFRCDYCSAGKITWRNLKAEYGTKETDWTPAPEDIDGSINALEGTTTTLTNQYTSLNQTLTSLTATVNSNTTQINTKADSSTVTAVQNTLTSLQADLSGFKTTVSNTYTTKTEFSDLEIGGRNLIVIKNVTVGSYYNSEGTIISEPTKKWGCTDWITVSGYKELICSGYTNLGHAPAAVFFNADKQFIKGIAGGNTAATAHLIVPENAAYLRFPLWLADLGKIKLEAGNKCTDWTPAPEDTDAAIAAVDNKFNNYSTTAAMNSAIEQKASSITQSVSATYATKNSLTNYATTQSVKASLALKIDKTDSGQIVSLINASADEINLKADRFSLESTYATITKQGVVNFRSGSIGGWDITSASIKKDLGNYRAYIAAPTTSGSWVFSCQKLNGQTYLGNWYVTADGYMYSRDGYLATRNRAVDGKGVEISQSQINFYSWFSKDNCVGKIETVKTTYDDYGIDINSLSVNCDIGDILQLGYTANNGGLHSAVTINDPAVNNGLVKFWSGISNIHFKAITQETSPNGNIATYIGSGYVMLSARSNSFFTDGRGIILAPYYDGATETWWIHAMSDTDQEPIKSTTLSIQVLYIDTNIIGTWE